MEADVKGHMDVFTWTSRNNAVQTIGAVMDQIELSSTEEERQ